MDLLKDFLEFQLKLVTSVSTYLLSAWEEAEEDSRYLLGTSKTDNVVCMYKWDTYTDIQICFRRMTHS